MSSRHPLEKQSMNALPEMTGAMADQKCPLCSQGGATVYSDFGRDRRFIQCIRCGSFHVTNEAELLLRRYGDLHLLSGVTREKSDRESRRLLRDGQQRESPQIDTRSLGGLFAQAPDDFDIATKVRKLLAAIARKSRQPGDDVEIHPDNDYPLAYARNQGELRYLIGYAEEIGWLKTDSTMHSVSCRLTPKGWEEVQHPVQLDSTTAFVAMWFDPSLAPAYTDGIKPAIEEDCHYRAIRIDFDETSNEDIVDQILAGIRTSRFVVVDVTGHRKAVYFEAGFAKGLGLPIIWTCRESDFKDKDKRTFDTEHFPHILWDEPTALREKLANRIKASIGIGSLRLQAE